MDKTFALIIICFAALCACFVTWAAIGCPKVSKYGTLFSWIYTSTVWLCVIAMIVLTIIY